MTITYDEFKKLDIKIAKVLKVELHPNADKLYLVTVDLGGEPGTGPAQKTLVAGIRSCYSKEELIGKFVVVLNNLQPAVIRGVQSDGMILAASDKDKKRIYVLTPDKPIDAGSAVS